MVNIATAGATAAKGGFGYLKIMSFMVLFSIILAAGIIHTIKEKSIKPLINEVGGNIFYTTNQLSIESEQIIKNGSITSDETGLKKIWEIIRTYATFILLLWMTIVWIRLFAKAYGSSPFSFSDNFFTNHLFGLLIFILLQILFGFLYYSINGGITNSETAIKIMYTPFLSLWLFAKAAYYVLSPVVDAADKIGEKLP